MPARDLKGPDENRDAVSKDTVRDVDVTKKNTLQSDSYHPKGEIPTSQDDDDEEDGEDTSICE